MPTTLYALSFRSSGNILGVCSLGQQALSDAKAWEALRDRLIGNRLAITFSKTSFELPATAVVVDQIEGSGHQADDVLVNPYAYRVAPADASQPAVPGDGKTKIATLADSNVIKGEPAFQDHTLTINLASALPPQTPAVVLFESGVLIKSSVDVGAKAVTFRCPAASAGDKYLLFMPGVPIEPRVIK